MHDAKVHDAKIVCVFPDKVSSSPEESPDTAWNRFFEEILLSKNIVDTTLPSKIMKYPKLHKKASFPNSSSYGNNFSPRRFLIEHIEANGIYSKMIFTNVLINQLKGDKSRKMNAREELWKAQDSSLFSPGNGQLRNDLRKSAYSSLLRAERMSRDNGKFIFSQVQYDFDFDGFKEYLLQDSQINCYIQQTGASIFELDYLPKDWNYLDCGSDENLNQLTSFADMLLFPDSKINELMGNKPEQPGRLCFNEHYDIVTQEKKGKTCFKLPALEDNTPFSCIEVSKCYLLKKDVLNVSYTLKNTGKELQKFLFVPGMNLSFTGVGDEFVRFYANDTGGKDVHLDINRVFNTPNLKILDVKNEIQLLFSSGVPFSGCIAPVFKNEYYQAMCILPAFTISLNNNEIWTNNISLKFSH